MERDYILQCGGRKIPCRCELPEGEVRRVVLGVHGFGGSMDDVIQAGISEEMALFGAASVRFDFPCHGKSLDDGKPLSLQPCLDALLTVAADTIAKFPQVGELCVFATGFGAYVTLLALPKLREMASIRLVIQTPSVCMHATLLNMLKISRETLRALDRYTVKAPRPFDISYGFYEELLHNIVLTTYDMPMLILHGEADDFINMADIRAFRSINEDAKLIIIPGTSHQFLEEGAWDMVLDLTRDWFACQQVLVADWE